MKLKGVYEGDGGQWRLVYADDKLCYLYPLGSGGIKCLAVPRDEFQMKLESGEYRETVDPYLPFSQEELSGFAAERAQKRFDLLESLLSSPAVLYDTRQRNSAIKTISKSRDVTVRHIHKLLAAWWERGQCVAALAPGYVKGNRKPGHELTRGRPSTVTQALRAALEKAYSKYLLKERPCTLPEAYRYFCADYMRENPGIEAPNYPTLCQFRYYFKKTHGNSEVMRRQNRKEVWEKDIRPLEGSVYQISHFPGWRYEIDSTEADVSLVRAADRSAIVDRPTLYVVTDSYSGMIVGVSASLDTPQYKGAADALFMAICDKKKICADMGVPLEEGEWPAKGVPYSIVADNAELLGGKIEKFCRLYGVHIDFTAPYRADQKGSVESSIGLVQSAIKGLMVGVPVKKTSKKAGYKDPRPESAYTLDEYRKFVLIGAMIANNRIRGKMPSEIGLDADPTPLGIWNWAERKGCLALTDPGNTESLRLSLLPSVQCTLSRNGILADGIRYQCDRARQAGFFDRQSNQSRLKGASLAYDPANVSQAWLYPWPDLKPSECWKCELAPEAQYLAGLSWKEAQTALEKMKERVAKAKALLESKNVKLTAQAQKLALEALAKKPAVKEKDSARIKKIKTNRQKEQIADDKSNPRTTPPEKKKIAPKAKARRRTRQTRGVKISSVGYPQLVKDIPN